MNTFRHHKYRAECGLTVLEEYVIGIVSEYEGHKSTFIRDHADFHKDKFSDLITKVLKKGFIERRVQDRNKSARLLFLTPLGKAYLSELQNLYGGKYEQ